MRFALQVAVRNVNAVPGQALQVFEQAHVQEDGTFYEFELVGCKCVGTYVRNKRNQNQVGMGL